MGDDVRKHEGWALDAKGSANDDAALITCAPHCPDVQLDKGQKEGSQNDESDRKLSGRAAHALTAVCPTQLPCVGGMPSSRMRRRTSSACKTKERRGGHRGISGEGRSAGVARRRSPGRSRALSRHSRRCADSPTG